LLIEAHVTGNDRAIGRVLATRDGYEVGIEENLQRCSDETKEVKR